MSKNRLWYTPDSYLDSTDMEKETSFNKRTGVNWIEPNRVDRVDFDVGTSHQITEYYNGYNKITKEEYDAHWKKYYLIKAIKELT
jgi:hypothetical protein